MTVGYDVQKISSYSFHNRVLYSGVFYSHDFDKCGFGTNEIVIDKFTNQTLNDRFGYAPASQDNSGSQVQKVKITRLPLAARLTLKPLSGGFSQKTIYFQGDSFDILFNQYRMTKGSSALQYTKSNSLVTVFTSQCDSYKGILTMEVISK